MDITRRALIAAGAVALSAATLGRRRGAWSVPPPDCEWRVPVQGGRIYVRVNGDLTNGAAPVMLVHGGPGANHAYLTPALQLSGQRGVILYDQLDCGLSDRPGDPANWTVDRFVSEIEEIRTALNLPVFHLVGHSWGGALALEYAARRPQTLASLTLASPLISVRSFTAGCRAQLATLGPAVRTTIDRDERAGTIDNPAYRQAIAVFEANFVQRRPEPTYITNYRRRIGTAINEKMAKTLCGPNEIRWTGTLRSYDGEPLLPRIAVPTLMLCGEYDEMAPAIAAPLSRRIADGRFASIADAGHFTPQDQPQRFVAALRHHLSFADDHDLA